MITLFENVVSIRDTNFICYAAIKEYQKHLQLNNDDFEWVHIVYTIKQEKPVVFYIRFLSLPIEVPPTNFKSHLQQIDTTLFAEVLFLVTYYGFFNQDSENLALLKETKKGKCFTYYFNDTFGKLLYHYQLEQLYAALTQSTQEEAITFRKAINLKRHNTFEKAKTIFLPTGESLYDVIKEYRYREFTLYPKLKEAIALYTFLHSK